MGAVRASAADSGSIAVFRTADAMAAGGKDSRSRAQTLMLPQRLEFVRRTGQKNDDARLAIDLGLKILPGRCAAVVGQHDCAFDDVSLLGVVCGHGDAPFGKALVHHRHDVVIALELDAQRRGDTLASEIVLCGTKSSDENGKIGTIDGSTGNAGEVVKIVADHGLEGDDHAQFIELLGEEK